MNRYIALILLLTAAGAAYAEVPLPEFSTEYELPETSVPAPAAVLYDYLDVVLLAVALLIAAWLALRKRSRRGLVVLGLVSLAYFGFWRMGCVCPIGAIQNVAMALGPGGYAVPTTVAAFFLLPLLAALLFGRVFCAGVCPLGALQDIVLLRPVRLPEWLRHALSVLPFIFLGLAVVFAVMAGPFIICQYDPFVRIFRLSGSAAAIAFGAVFVALSAVVARPYCRFLCPYAVLLSWMSRVAKWHVTITPDECIQCRLCEDSCPFDAIRKPSTQPVGRTEGKKLLVVLLVLLPVMAAVAALPGYWAGDLLARADQTVRTADLVWQNELTKPEITPDEVTAFARTGRPAGGLYAEAAAIVKDYRVAGLVFGAWAGLVIGGKLIALSIRRTRSDYEPDRAHCLSCGRCFEYCPRERMRHARTVETSDEQPAG